MRSLPLSLTVVEFSEASNLSRLKNKYTLFLWLSSRVSCCVPSDPHIVCNILNLGSCAILSMIMWFLALINKKIVNSRLFHLSVLMSGCWKKGKLHAVQWLAPVGDKATKLEYKIHRVSAAWSFETLLSARIFYIGIMKCVQRLNV